MNVLGLDFLPAPVRCAGSWGATGLTYPEIGISRCSVRARVKVQIRVAKNSTPPLLRARAGEGLALRTAGRVAAMLVLVLALRWIMRCCWCWLNAAHKLSSPDCGWPVDRIFTIPAREPSNAAGATTSGNAAAPFWMGHRHRTPAVLSDRSTSCARLHTRNAASALVLNALASYL